MFLFPAPGGPPQSFTVTQRRERNMTFSWSPPVPTLRNGVITGYSLSCVPETGGGNSITMQYTAAGTFTLGGFTPATSYNCSISARNSQGSGLATYLINTTLEACKWEYLHRYIFFTGFVWKYTSTHYTLVILVQTSLLSSWCPSTEHHGHTDWWFSYDVIFLLAAATSKCTKWDDHRIHHSLYS